MQPNPDESSNGDIVVGEVEYWASLGNLKQTLRAIESGADVNATSKGNYSALHGAAVNGHADIIRLLLNHGADKTLKLTTGETAADLAVLSGHPELVELLS